MKKGFTAITIAAILLLSFTAFASNDTRAQRAKKRQISKLVSLLPASDGVAIIDSKRFFSDALPQVLSANQPVLNQITTKLSEIESRTGISLRKFDNVAVGVEMTEVRPKEVDFDTVAIASGDVNAGALLAIAKLASNGAYREEKVNGRVVFVFTAKDVMQKTSQTSNSKITDVLSKALDGLTKEVAVSALDNNTLVFGSFKRVSETVGAKSHVSADLDAMLARRASSVMGFALKTPNGTSKFLPLDNDELGKNIDSIRFLSGSIDVATAGTSLNVTAQTIKPEQAEGLKNTLAGLQGMFGGILSVSKRPDQQLYGRLLKAAKFNARANEVTIDLLVPQADIDTLIGGIK